MKLILERNKRLLGRAPSTYDWRLRRPGLRDGVVAFIGICDGYYAVETTKQHADMIEKALHAKRPNTRKKLCGRPERWTKWVALDCDEVIFNMPASEFADHCYSKHLAQQIREHIEDNSPIRAKRQPALRATTMKG